MTAETRSPHADPSTAPVTRTPAPTWHWLRSMALVAGAAGVVGLFVLPSPFPLLILVALVVAGLALVARDARATPAGVVRDLRVRATATDQRYAQFAAWAALGFMVLAGIGFKPSATNELLTVPLLFAVAGGVSLGLALWFAPAQPLSARAGEAVLRPARSQWPATALGVGLLAALAHISSAKAMTDMVVRPVTNDVQFLLLAAGIGLVVWGLSGAPTIDLTALRGRVRWGRALPLLAIFALALGLRVWNLGEAVRGSVDEAVVLEGIGHSWSYRDAGLVTQVSDRLSASQLFPYWQTVAIGLFGRSLDSLRLVNAVVGALTVFAIYLLGRALFDHKTGLVAALLLATFPPHLHFSRIAMAHIADPLFGTLAFAFLVRGFKHNRRLDWALCGASLGLTQYFFEGGRLLFPPLLALSAVALALLFRPAMRRRWQGLMVAGLAALFVAAPVYYSLFALDRPRASRLSDSGLDLDYLAEIVRGEATSAQVSDFLNRLTFPFQIYVHQPEIAAYYGGQQALILEWLVPVFLFGVAFLLWRARTPTGILLLWLFFGGLANVLMRDIAIYTRFIVVFPALVLAVAAALRYGLPLLLPALRDRRLAAGMTVAAALIAFGQADYYFRIHLPAYMPQLRNMTVYDGMDAVLRAQSLPQTTQVILVGQPAYDGEVSRIFDGFLSQRINDMALRSLSTEQLTPEYIATLPRDRSYAFFVAPGSEAVVDLLNGLFELEGPRFTPYGDVPSEKAYALYLAHWRVAAG